MPSDDDGLPPPPPKEKIHRGHRPAPDQEGMNRERQRGKRPHADRPAPDKKQMDGPHRKGRPDPMKKAVPPEVREGKDPRFDRSPEERERFQKLLDENPRKFQEAVFEDIHKQRMKDFETVKALRKAYLDARGTDQEESAKSALREEISKQVYRNLEKTEKHLKAGEERLEETRKRLDGFREEYEKRKAGAEESIDKFLNKLTDPEFKLPDFDKKPFQKDKMRNEGPRKSKDFVPGEKKGRKAKKIVPAEEDGNIPEEDAPVEEE